METDKEPDDLLSKVDPEKRDLLKKVAVGATFALPVILSFSMDAVKAKAAEARSPIPVSPNQ